jgi:hypothetical protein
VIHHSHCGIIQVEAAQRVIVNFQHHVDNHPCDISAACACLEKDKDKQLRDAKAAVLEVQVTIMSVSCCDTIALCGPL